MQIQELAAQLQPLGLADKEARVYVAALFLGPSSVQKIATQADINRATAYVILDQLSELGLISQSQEGKKTVFVAEPPEALEQLFERQQDVIKERRHQLQALLPNLSKVNRTATDKAPVVRFFKGRTGRNAVSAENRRQVRPGSTVYGFSNYDEVEKFAPDIWKSSPTARVKKKISSKLIYSYKSELSSDPKALREVKRMSQPVKADIIMYEDRVSLTNYGDSNPTGIVIESPEIVGALRQLFELAFKNQK